MANQRYAKRSREDHVIDLVTGHIDRVINHLSEQNPMPPGETRIDPRTARKRLEMVHPDDLYSHLSGHG